MPRRPLGHVDRERLHEAQRHVDPVAPEDELEVPKPADHAPGGDHGGVLTRFDLEGDDGVEVFELGGGEDAGDDGDGLDEFCDADAGARGGEGGAGSQGGG